jgi:NADH-quinone oxidoreductase subunit J
MENILQILLLSGIGMGSFFTLSSKNPVHSVLFLILVFICGAGVLLYLGAEFIALIFIIVYVGAIAVLFLFIVMMLDIKLNRTRSTFLKYLPFSLLFGVLFLIEVYISIEDVFLKINFQNSSSNWYLLIDKLSNTELLGQVLYQEFMLCFLLCGILLLIAMLGAIVLTQKFSSARTNEITEKQLSRGEKIFFSFYKIN